MIHLDVRNIAGEQLALSLSHDRLVSAAKSVIADEWGIPSTFLSLVHGTAEMIDSDKLTQYLEGDEMELSVTVLLSMNAALLDLECGSRARTCCALSEFVALGMKGGWSRETLSWDISSGLRRFEA